jgi:hypothetical protein
MEGKIILGKLTRIDEYCLLGKYFIKSAYGY